MPNTLVAELQAFHSIAASETTAPFVSVPGTPQGCAPPTRGRTARVQYQNALLTASSGTLTFTVSYSYDRGATWTNGASGAAITLSTTAQAGEQSLDVTPTGYTDTGVVLIRVLATFGGTPTNPAAVYRADLNEA